MTATPLRWFLGSTTPNGFSFPSAHLYHTRDWRVFIIKGGPGTGKSTFLKNVQSHWLADGAAVETFHCSASPTSLDAVRSEKHRTLVIDGTAPHIVEPTCWDACERILPFCLCTDPTVLDASAVVSLADEKRRLHRLCARSLETADAHLAENRRLQKSLLNTDKIRRFAQRVARNEWGKPLGRIGTVATRYLTALTPDGITTFYDTLQALCPRIYVIEDDCGGAASVLLQELCDRAIADGLNVWKCPSPLFREEMPIHLIIPSIGVGFTVSNRHHTADFPVYRRIHTSRFESSDNPHRARMLFNRRAATELVSAATEALIRAAAVHRQLEDLYHSAVDWKKHEDNCLIWLHEIL